MIRRIGAQYFDEGKSSSSNQQPAPAAPKRPAPGPQNCGQITALFKRRIYNKEKLAQRSAELRASLLQKL